MLNSKTMGKILNKTGITGPLGLKLVETLVGTGVDTGFAWIYSGLFGMEFNLGESLRLNAFANALTAFISDPVDAVTGTYVIHTTDFILASVPLSLQLDRAYYSTSG